MLPPFAEKLALVLKVLSMSRAHLASQVGVDKSVVARWASGTASPSAHNLARLSGVMADKIPGFTALDWDRDMESFAELLGVGRGGQDESRKGDDRPGMVLPLMDQILSSTRIRAAAYEGFYRSTRPYPGYPGQFIHDSSLVRMGADGLLRLYMSTGGVLVEGWLLPVQNQLFIVGAEFTTGALVFGILHGVNTVGAEILDGITLYASLDPGRTITATAMITERVARLSGDQAADDARLLQMDAGDPLAPAGSVPEEVRRHLARDIGPAQAALGGDWVLRLPLALSLARGELPKLA